MRGPRELTSHLPRGHKDRELGQALVYVRAEA